MPLSTRNNPYSFDAFLEWRNGFDYYRDDAFLQKVAKHFAGDAWERVNTEARRLSPRVSFRWRDIADASARPEKRPFMLHYDAHNHRIDRIVRPGETETMEKGLFSEGLFSKNTPFWVRLVKQYLVHQNGEACITCPMVCTEGLIAMLEPYADTPETRRILQHCKEGIDGDFAIGAQFVTEIQGGSDIPAGVLEAVEENGVWRLYGTKFFCSATHADYALVTGKRPGSEDTSIFVVPAWLPGNKAREIRNGYTIDRIKWKMGTSELPTAEITYNGAIGYPVGPMDRGVANIVGIVLTTSRLTVGISGAASMARAAREAKKYSEFRTAFGRPIGQFPLLANQIRTMEREARRATAGAFKVYGAAFQLEGGFTGGLPVDASLESRKARFDVRELIMLQKMATTLDCIDVLHAAISVFAGHGVMEDFSSLPRLFRDAVINEQWEGPRNTLLTQVHRDLQRVAGWYPPADFVAHILDGGDPAVVRTLGSELTELVAHPSLLEMDEKTLSICERWDSFCHTLFHAYQDVALAEVEAGGRQ